MSNKSLLQMVRELQNKVAFLETEIAAIRRAAPKVLQPGLDAYAREYERKFPEAAAQAVTISVPVVLDTVKPPEKKPKMCPKCGVKPGYFFHVRTCTGQKEEKQDAENTVRRRDQGKT